MEARPTVEVRSTSFVEIQEDAKLFVRMTLVAHEADAGNGIKRSRFDPERHIGELLFGP
jgi:hypothetical protein